MTLIAAGTRAKKTTCGTTTTDVSRQYFGNRKAVLRRGREIVRKGSILTQIVSCVKYGLNSTFYGRREAAAVIEVQRVDEAIGLVR